MGYSCTMFQPRTSLGTSARGRLLGITSGRMEVKSRIACAARMADTTMAGFERGKLGNLRLLLVLEVVEEIDGPVNGQQHCQCDQENNPAFERMEKSVRPFGINFAQNAGNGDAARVCQN